MTACPDHDLLARLLLDDLDPAGRAEVEGHVDACPACQEALDALSGSPPAPAAAVDPAQLTFHLDRIKRRGPAAAARPRRPPPPTAPTLVPGAEPNLAPRPSTGGLPAVAGFRLIREVGRGGMGVVYEAIEETLNRRVALKIVTKGAAKSPTTLERFRREARAAARLHHTNIVPVFGVGEDGACLYYTMQLIEGEGLDRVFARLCLEAGTPTTTPEPTRAAPPTPADPTVAAESGDPGDDGFTLQPSRVGPPTSDPIRPESAAVSVPAPAPSPGDAAVVAGGPSSGVAARRSHHRTVARIGWQVAEALRYAHKQGIVHRDIKLANILIDGQGTAWVADFGLAKAAEGDDLTQTGDLVGTLRYMSPERFDGRADARGDVYALGVTLYELLTRRPLFPDENWTNLIRRIMHEEPPRPRLIDRAIPRDLETIVLKATAKEPAARYPAAAALAEDLRRHLAGEPILARPLSLAERAWRWARRYPVVAALLTLLAAVLVGGFAAMVVLRNRAEGAAQTALHRQEEAQLARGNEARARQAAEAGERAALASREQAIAATREEAKTRAASVLQTATLQLDTGAIYARQGRVGRGLLWLDRGLQTAPPDAAPLRAAALADMGAWAARAAVPLAVLEHEDPFYGITLSPDGRTLAVASIHEVHLYGPGSTVPPRTLAVPGLHVRVVFSPDGAQVATGSHGAGVALWDVATGELARRLVPPNPEERWEPIRFTPDGRRLLAVARYAGEASLVAIPDGRRVGRPMAHAGATFALTPDGTRVASGGPDGAARIWDAATGEPLGVPILHDQPVHPTVATAGDALLFVTNPSRGGGMVRVRDAATAAPRVDIALRSHSAIVAFSPDAQSVLIGDRLGTAQLYDVTTGRGLGATIRAEAPIRIVGPAETSLVAFSPNGQVVATAHVDNTVRLWDAVTGRPWGPVLEHDREVLALAFRPDGRTLLTGDAAATVRVWDVTPTFAGRVIRTAPFVPDSPRPVVALDPAGRTLALAEDGVVRLLDLATGLPLAPPLVHDAGFGTPGPRPLLGFPRIRVVRFSPDGRTLATGGDDGYARLWDVATGQPRGALPHALWVLTLEFSPDGRTLATGCAHNYAQLWVVATGQPHLGRLSVNISKIFPGMDTTGRSNEVRYVAISGDGRTLVTVGNYDSARLWDTTTGQQINPQDNPSADPDRASGLSRDGMTFLLRTGATTRVWDLRERRLVGTGFGADEGRFAFSPDGRRLVTVAGTSAQVWDVAARQRVGGVIEHPTTPLVAAFTPDGATILTGARDGLVRRWDAATGRPVGPPLEHGPAVEHLIVPPDGAEVIALGGYRCTAWPLTVDRPADPTRLAHRLAMRRFDDRGDVQPLAPADWRALALAGSGAAGPLVADSAGAADFHDRMAAYYADDNRPAAARWHLDRLVALRPDDWSVLARRSAALRTLGDPAAADADRGRVDALAPPEHVRAGRATFDLAEAQAAVRAGRWADGLPALDRLVADRPGLVALHRRRIQILAALGRWDAAEAATRSLGSAGPASLDEYYQAALIRLAAHNPQGYRDLCEALLRRVRPDPPPQVANSLAWTCVLAPTPGGLPDAALALARRATEDPEGRAMTLKTLGAALHRAGQHDEAIKTIGAGIALRQDQGGPQDWAFLVLAHARLGHKDEARRYLDRLDAWQPADGWQPAFENLEITLLRDEARAAVAAE